MAGVLPFLSIFFGLLSIFSFLAPMVFRPLNHNLNIFFLDLFWPSIFSGLIIGIISLKTSKNKVASIIGIILSLGMPIALIIMLSKSFSDLELNKPKTTVKEAVLFRVDAPSITDFTSSAEPYTPPPPGIIISPDNRYLFLLARDYCYKYSSCTSFLIDIKEKKLYLIKENYFQYYEWSKNNKLYLISHNNITEEASSIIISINNNNLEYEKNNITNNSISDNKDYNYSLDKKYYYSTTNNWFGCFQECGSGAPYGKEIKFYSSNRKLIGNYIWEYKNLGDLITGNAWNKNDELIIAELQGDTSYKKNNKVIIIKKLTIPN